MVVCLGRGADLHTARLMPLPLTISCSSKSRLVLPSWYRLTRVVPAHTGSPRRNPEGRKMVVVAVVWDICLTTVSLIFVGASLRSEV